MAILDLRKIPTPPAPHLSDLQALVDEAGGREVLRKLSKPKLILLYGFAGIGKTTLADRYANTHPLCLNLEGDRIIVMLGQWLKYEVEARERVFEFSKAMTRIHLKRNHDVIIPYLLTNLKHAKDFENIAKEIDAHFFEVALDADKEQTIQRLLKRGTWGEEGTEPLTEVDLPLIEKMYDDMTRALMERRNVAKLPVVEGEHESTYRKFREMIEG